MFAKLKGWRWIATCYDRLSRKYLAGLALIAVITEWCKWVPYLED